MEESIKKAMKEYAEIVRIETLKVASEKASIYYYSKEW